MKNEDIDVQEWTKTHNANRMKEIEEACKRLKKQGNKQESELKNEQ